jgi:hypothetical protein
MAEGNEQRGQQAAGTAAVSDRRTRRRLLAGAAGVLVVAAAEVVGQAAPAQANNGNPVLQGTDNVFPTRRTAVFTPDNTEVGILADPNSSGKGSLGVYGIGRDAGVLGQGTGADGGNGAGVEGIGAPGADGVTGQSSGGGFGVHGISSSTSGYGVVGEASVGVAGSGTGAGVWGTGHGGPGVRGTSTEASAPGVLAENTASGTALQVSGPAAFSRSGALTVPAGKSSATQTGVALTSASLVLATLQQNLSGVYVRAAVPNTAGSSFTVYLSKAPTASTKVAWFVVN